MEPNHNYFAHRYNQFEKELMNILDYIDISENWGDPCYQVGSIKLMDFCLNVCSEIETLFELIIRHPYFDPVEEVVEYRKDFMNIDQYRKGLNPIFKLEQYELFIPQIKKKIKPFEEFGDNGNPYWFRIYSPKKHKKHELIKEWTLKESVLALGGFLILCRHHPGIFRDSFKTRPPLSNNFFVWSDEVIGARIGEAFYWWNSDSYYKKYIRKDD